MRSRAPAEMLCGVLLSAYPAVTFVRGGVNTVFALLLLLSLWMLVYLRGQARDDPATRMWVVVYAAAMASMPLAVLCSEWARSEWIGRYFDAPSRFLLAVPVFLALRRLPTRHWRWLGLGFAAGALYAAGAVLFDPFDYGPGRPGLYFLYPIPFGDLALIIGVLAAMSVDWVGRDRPWERVFKYLALLGGGLASVLSASRGGWVAVPFLGLWWLWFRRDRLSLRMMLALVVGAAALAGAAYGLVPTIHQRIDLIGSNLLAFDHGDPNTSIGLRFQLWRAAWWLFWQHPWFGVGPEGFRLAMPMLQHMGVLSPLAAQIGMAENEIIAKAVQNGLPGLLSVLSVYVVPFVLFLRRSEHSDAVRRRAARMGVVLVSAFFIFGLTVEIFVLTMLSAFYALSCAVLLAVVLRSDAAD